MAAHGKTECRTAAARVHKLGAKSARMHLDAGDGAVQDLGQVRHCHAIAVGHQQRVQQRLHRVRLTHFCVLVADEALRAGMAARLTASE